MIICASYQASIPISTVPPVVLNLLCVHTRTHTHTHTHNTPAFTVRHPYICQIPNYHFLSPLSSQWTTYNTHITCTHPSIHLCCFSSSSPPPPPPPPLISHSAGVEAAVKAMELVNGYIMREKPVVITYGRTRANNRQYTSTSVS